MPAVRAAVGARPLEAFWLLAFATSWAYWVPLALWSPGTTHFPGLLGPLVAAVVVAAATGDLRALAARCVRWRVPGRLWLATVLPLATALVAVVVLAPWRGRPTVAALTSMDGVAAVGWLGVVAIVLVVNGFGEEVGWRGLAWPRLRARHGTAGAAVRLAVPWALWHLPTFWLDTGMAGFPLQVVPGWLVGLTAGCVALGWLSERSGSLLLPAVFHTGLNLGSATVATEGLPAAAVSAVVVAWAVCVLRDPRAHRPLAAPDVAAEPPVRTAAG